jgi:cytosine/adenosine deaminase-related metal-dependent hydrolase
MKKLNGLFLLFAFCLSAYATASEVVVVGYIPDRYIKTTGGKKYQLGAVHIKDRVIQAVEKVTSSTQAKKKFAGKKIIFAKTGSKYDYLYPGFIDLHNHTKQNNLGVWGEAKGQFLNRFEWRAWSIYKYSVSGNMNPWIGYGKPITCAAFRWSELQAMILGTTYLQGPSSCIKNFGIHQVEDNGSYITNKDKVQAPTDLVIPADMTFVWDELRPKIQSGMTYAAAIAEKVNEHCDIPGVNEKSVMTSKMIKVFKDKKKLVESCTKGKLHPKFVRYVYWIHGSIASKISYVQKGNGALIAHLSEGSREDAYNTKEYEVARMLGFVGPHINYVHGVGISDAGLKEMGKNQMGIIWSPFSNLLLYGETLDIAKAKKAGVILSIGSDWLPTGSRGILEEVKLAANYVDKDPDGQGLKKIFNDEELYLLMTENPAKMINHWDIDIKKKEHGVGRIAVGAMGTLVAVKNQSSNPYTSLVRKGFAEDVNLVVVDGNPVYGNESHIKEIHSDYETLPKYYSGLNKLVNGDAVKHLPEKGSNKAKKTAQLNYLAKTVKAMKLKATDKCGFKVKKALAYQSSVQKDSALTKFQNETGINLDRFEDLHKIIAIGMLTQSRNRNEPSKGKDSFKVTEFPSLYSCNDEGYMKRLFSFVDPNTSSDEFTVNPENRDALRAKQSLGRVPEKLGEAYSE